MPLIDKPGCCTDAAFSATFAALDPVSVVMSLRGEIDIDDVGHLAHLVDEVLRSGAVILLVVDLARLTFLGVRGISALVDTRTTAATSGCRLTLARPAPVVHRLLEITGQLELVALPAQAPPASIIPQVSSPPGAAAPG